MMKSKSLLPVGLLLATFLVATASAASVSRINYLKISKTSALPGVVLPPGEYAFEALEGHPDIVRVKNRAQNRVLYMGFVDPVRRTQESRTDNMLTFGEAAPGVPLPITAWFPLGGETGHAFRHR